MEHQNGVQEKKFDDILTWALRIICFGMIVYQMIYSVTLCLGSWSNMNLHLLLSFIVVFLSSMKKSKSKKWWPVYIGLLIVSFVCCGYIFTNMKSLIKHQGVLNQTDIIIGVLLVLITLEAAREVGGNLFPVIALVGVAYTFFGHYLPDPFWHFKISLSSAVGKFCMAQAGIFGDILSLSATYLFLMMVFGSLLVASGADAFFWEVGKLAGRRMAGGPGIIAVVSSMLFGMVSGSGPANVAVTGTFTIPMMKKVGYKPEEAAAIESVASTGGLFVPPIMGSAAFVMAGFTGVSYGKICVMAIIPCVLYYLSCGLFVQFNAQKHNISAMTDEKVDYKVMLGTGYLFFIPLALIIALLVMGYSLRIIVFVCVIATILLCMTRKESRYSIVKWLDIFVDAAHGGIMIAVSGATIGVLLGALDLTGLAVKFPSIVTRFSGGNLLVALFLTMIVTIVLGMGVPPFAAYITAAMLCVPALVTLGANKLAAHFFILFLAAIGQITPPIAISCFVAAPLAKTSYIKTCLAACKCAVISWFIPFFAIYVPGTLLLDCDPIITAFQIVCIVVSCFLLQSAFAGHYFWTELNLPERLVNLAAAAVLLVFVFYPMLIIGIVGFVAFVIVTYLDKVKYTKRNAIKAE